MCNCPIPFLSQNDCERVGNLNYSWRQVSILHMHGMENKILSVAIDPSSLISKQKERNYDVWLMEGVKKLPTLDSSMLRQKMQHLYQSILH